MKNKILYYVLQWTWGLPMSILGGLVFLVAVLCRWRTYMWNNAVCIVFPKQCGGMNLGMFFIRGKNSKSVCSHEYGHSIQNIQWGPLFLFVIGLPSLIRYIYRQFYYKYLYKKTRKSLPAYDSIWFEGQATEYGKKYGGGV